MAIKVFDREITIEELISAFFIAIGGIALTIILYVEFIEKFIKIPESLHPFLFISVFGLFFFLGLRQDKETYIYSSKIYEKLKGELPKQNVLYMKEKLINFYPNVNTQQQVSYNNSMYADYFVFPIEICEIQSYNYMNFSAYASGSINGIKVYYGQIQKTSRTIRRNYSHFITHTLLLVLNKNIGLGYCKKIDFSNHVTGIIADTLYQRKARFNVEEIQMLNSKYEFIIDNFTAETNSKAKNFILTLLNLLLTYVKQTEIIYVGNLLFIDVSFPNEATKNDPNIMLEEVIKLVNDFQFN
ncbi:MAG: hypothetical protein QXF76_03390 [Candidatus Anstonellales archaeon]